MRVGKVFNKLYNPRLNNIFLRRIGYEVIFPMDDDDNESVAGVIFNSKEMRIIRKLVSGRSYKIIAEELSEPPNDPVSPKAVEHRVRDIFNYYLLKQEEC
jgi:DNA-binding NarL/FixJ family response regulator